MSTLHCESEKFFTLISLKNEMTLQRSDLFTPQQMQLAMCDPKVKGVESLKNAPLTHAWS